MEVDYDIRRTLIQKRNPFDPPYIELRKHIVEWAKKEKIPMNPYFQIEKIEDPIIFYTNNVSELGAKIIDEIKNSNITFVVNYCTNERTDPSIYIKKSIEENFLWYSSTIVVEFSFMFILEDPYFPHKVPSFQFPTETLSDGSYVLATPFRLIQVLKDLYDPSKAAQWKDLLKEAKSLASQYKPLEPVKRGGEIKEEKNKYKFLFGNEYASVSEKIFISSAGENIEKSLKKLYPDSRITLLINRGRVPGDMRVKHTLYRVNEKDIFRVFNLTEYELIPRNPETTETTLPVKLRCELIAATMLLLLGVNSSKFITYLITDRYKINDLTIDDLVVPTEWYIGTNYPYDDYVKKLYLETRKKKSKQ